MKRNHKRGLIALLAGLMSVSLILPSQAFAASMSKAPVTEKDSDGNEYYSHIYIDPFDYTNVGGGSAVTLDESTLLKIVDDKLLGGYAYIANDCFKTAGKCATIDSSSFEYNFENTDPNMSKLLGDSCGNLRDMLISKNSQGSSKKDSFKSTGLCAASSLGQVREVMAQSLKDGVGRKTVKTQDFLNQASSKDGVLSELDKDDENLCFYSIATSIDQSTAFKYKYSSFGLCFYDFSVSPICADDLVYKSSMNDYDSYEEAKAANAKGIKYDTSTANKTAYAIENNSDNEVSEAVSYKNSESASITNSVSTSESVKYTQSNTLSFQFGSNSSLLKFPLAQITESITFGFEETYQTTNGVSKTTNCGHEDSTTINASIPAYTAKNITSETTDAVIAANYDTPVQLNYKVAIFSMTGQVYADDAATCNFSTAGYEHGYYLNTIGGTASQGASANENLYQRTVINPKTGRNDATSAVVHKYWKNNGGSSYNKTNEGVNWSKLSCGVYIKYHSEHIPMLSNGCTLNATYKAIKSSVGETVPMYLMNHVILTSGDSSYQLSIGDQMNLSKQLSVEGRNRYDSLYYGFNEKDGEWVLCDKNGKTSDIKTEDSCVKISTDAKDEQILDTSKAGTAYITWKLKKGVKYTSNNDSGSITCDSDIESPIIELNVLNEGFKGTVSISGDFDACVGDSDLNLNDQLIAVGEDEYGREVAVPIVWEQKEIKSKGIVVQEDGSVTFTKAGTFHVCAIVKNEGTSSPEVRSEWYEITVKPERTLATATLDMSNVDLDLVFDSPNEQTQSYDLDSFIKAYDQYGNVWKGELPDIDYKLASDSTNASIYDNVLTISGPGSFEVVPVVENASDSYMQGINDCKTLISVRDNLKFEKEAISLKAGAVNTLTPLTDTGECSEAEVKWTTSDSSVAKVDQNGKVSALSVGKATITAKTDDGNEAICSLTVTKGNQNPVIVTNTKTVKVSKLKKRSVTTSALKVTGTKENAKTTFKKVGGSSRLSLSKDGGIVVKKRTKTGIYKIKVKVSATSTKNYKTAVSDVKTVKVRVK